MEMSQTLDCRVSNNGILFTSSGKKCWGIIVVDFEVRGAFSLSCLLSLWWLILVRINSATSS